MEYGPLGCSYRLPKSRNQQWRYLYDSTRRMARRSQCPQNYHQTQNVLYGQNQALRLWHDDINAFRLSHGFTKSLANPNLYLHSDSILILLYADNISMSYPKAAAKAATEVNTKLSGKFKVTDLGMAHQSLSIEIHRNGTGVSLRHRSLYHQNPQTIRHWAYSLCLDAHGSQYKIWSGQGPGGEGIGTYHRLSSSCRITNVCSTCNSARYLVSGCCSFLLQFTAIHQLYDCC